MAHRAEAFLLLLIALIPLVHGQVKFSIIHYNDVHSRVEPADSNALLNCAVNDDLCYGGFARLATVLNQTRAAGPTLFVDAGDQFVGTLYNYFYRGREVVEFQNILKTDVMTLGNHEFDYGPNVTASYLKNLSFPVATCNVNPLPTSPLYGLIKPGPVILNVTLEGGSVVPVGIVGWTTVTTAYTSSPGKDVEFLDLVSSVQACVDNLTASGVKIIIGLGHAGLQDDGDTLVAANVKGLDLVIGGHSHTFLYNGTKGPILDINRPTTAFDSTLDPSFTYPYPVKATYDPSVVIPYFQCYFAGRYIGNLSVTFDNSGNLVGLSGYPILLGGRNSSNNVVKDPVVDAVVQSYAVPLANFSQSIIGSAAVLLEGTRGLVRGYETNLGNLITDALIWEIKRNSKFETVYGSIDIAFTNGGGIRASILPGNITVANVISVLPFGNVLVIKRVTGAQLLEILSRSASAWNFAAPFGGFLQVSGLAYTFDVSKSAGQRLIEAFLLNPVTKCLSPIVNTTVYNVVTNDFTGRGGDGYTSLENATLLTLGRVMSDVVMDYIGEYSPVSPVVEGRIKVLNGTSDTYVEAVPCTSGLTCKLTPSNFSCVAPPLPSPSSPVPSCNPKKCVKNAYCTPAANVIGYVCTCSPGYKGYYGFSKYRPSKCVKVTNAPPAPSCYRKKCVKNAYCTPAANVIGYVCTCSPGYKGYYGSSKYRPSKCIKN